MVEFPTSASDYESCVAYYRNALSARRAAQVRAYLEANPDTARRAQADAHHERAIAQALDDVLREPLPARLTANRRPTATAWLQRLAFATIVVSSAAMGWWLGNMPATTDDGADNTFAKRVVTAARQPVAHTRLTPVTRASAAVPAPDLTTQGYQLLNRHKPASQPGLIEFVYRKANGQRLRIFAEAGRARHTAPVVSSHDGMAVAQWREGDTRYALVGNMTQLSLRTLAQAAQTGTSPGSDNMLADNRKLQTSRSEREQNDMPVQPQLPGTNEIAPAVAADGYTVQPTRM